MSRPLHRTRRCRVFESIAEKIWFEIIQSHRVNVEVIEPGITNRIITEIRRNADSYPNFGVWANNGYNEHIHGSDLDIFVEASTGNFIWYALQAKVLKLNGTYDSMSTLRGGEYQWDKLTRLSVNANCVVSYLFYNGVDGYKYSGLDYCERRFNDSQFGCSLVSLDDVQRISLSRIPRFLDFHPQYAQPWRIITCCINYPPKKNIAYYSRAQIKRAVDYYPQSFGNIEMLNTTEEDEKIDNNFPVNAIVNFSEQVERNPFYRIVIRNTESLRL